MRLVDYLDKGASLGGDAPCLTTDGHTRTYAEVQHLSREVSAALAASGVEPGQSVAILSANDPVAFSTVFGISRAGAVWCPVNPRGEASENRELLELFDCVALVFQPAFAPLVAQIAPELPRLTLLVCLDSETDSDSDTGSDSGSDTDSGTGSDSGSDTDSDTGGGGTVAVPGAISWAEFLARGADQPEHERDPVDGPNGVAMIVGTGGTTGRPKGVQLTGTNLETMTAITLMAYPWSGRPVYLALAPLTHAAGVLCFPVMTMGGEIVIMRSPDLGAFLDLVPERGVTHTFLPPTLIYMLLAHDRLTATDLSSLQCFWYGAAPMSATRLAEAMTRIGPMAQLFGQTEAPMMISTMSPAEHYLPDGSVASARLSSAGRPSPLVTVAIMGEGGELLAQGERGEIVVRSSLVMAGYYGNPEATAEASAHGWHHTGDIGLLDQDGFLFIVDRAKDMIITGGFNVYSSEVEQVLLAHPEVQDCAVIGLPDEKWGERVVAVLQARGDGLDLAAVREFARARLGGVKTPKQWEIWPDLPRSKVGKVLKSEIRTSLSASEHP